MTLFLPQLKAVFFKNWRLLCANKKKICGDLAFPCLLGFFFYLYRHNQASIIAFILKFVLMLSLGLLNNSAIRQIVTLFITQRQESHREYQMIMGLSYKMYTISNLFYQLLYYSIIYLPLFVVINFYDFNLLLYFYIFFCYLVSGGCLSLMLTSLFKDQKIAVEVIGFIFSMGSFLAIIYDPEFSGLKRILFEMVPNCSFTLSIMTTEVSDKVRISSVSLLMAPVYLLAYTFIEYKQIMVAKLRKMFPRDNRNEGLLQEIELESQMVFLEYIQNNQIPLRPEEVAINIDKISKKFGNTTAVNNLSLKIPRSKIFGLLGRNGAGKTTLVDIITKVTKPTEGIITFTLPSSNRPKLGICYQKQILYEELSAEDHLKFFSMIKGLQNSSQHINQLVEKVGFQQPIDKKVKELSGGYKRKLSVSLALLGSPMISIFDEPTSGLDPHSRRMIWQILSNLKKEDITVILTTHHLDEADYLSDTICVMQKGNKILEQSPEEIKRRYGQGYYLTLYLENIEEQNWQRVNKLISDIKQLKGSDHMSVLEKQIDEVKYFINKNINYEDLCLIIKIIEGKQSVRMNMGGNSLEQSFIALISEHQEPQQENDRDLYQSEIVKPGNLTQIWGVLVKNMYCFIRKYYGPYCLTIIVFLIVLAIDMFLINKLSNQAQALNTETQNKQEEKPMSSMVIISIFILMASSFIGIPMQEKQKKIIMLLRTRGLKKINYWLGHYLFDITYFMLCYLILWFFLPSIFQQCSLLMMFQTGTGIILFAYSATLLFEKKKTANTWFTLGNFLLYIMTVPFLSPIDFTKETFYSYFKIIKYIYPYFDMQTFLIRQEDQLKPLYENVELQPQQTHIYYSISFFLLILTIIQSNVFLRIFKRKPKLTSQNRIEFQTLTKKYGKTEALKNVSYSIDNERVALLGHNGAGKSTTFSLLSSQVNPSSGNIFIEYRLKPSHQQILQSTGICYQENTLWDALTCDEIIRIFSIFLGVKDYEKEKKALFQGLEFQYSDKKFEHLSGGNKRKLCLCACLMGHPKTRLLDECSTGLDPVSRVSMVKTIKQQINGSTVFTTHSIPEAEDLCSRAIIMKKGCVEEDDKIYKLKEKYYDCHWIYLELEQKSDYDGACLKIFEGWNLSKLRFDKDKKFIECNKSLASLSEIMLHMHEMKKKGIVKDFRVEQPKFEDVYLQITREGQGQPGSEQQQLIHSMNE